MVKRRHYDYRNMCNICFIYKHTNKTSWKETVLRLPGTITTFPESNLYSFPRQHLSFELTQEETMVFSLALQSQNCRSSYFLVPHIHTLPHWTLTPPSKGRVSIQNHQPASLIGFLKNCLCCRWDGNRHYLGKLFICLFY